VDYLFGEDNDSVVFSNNKLSTEQMSYLYNSADGTILLTSNEGWGLALTESLLTGTPIIANTTGGMQDQMRFVDNEGKWFTPTPEIPSNHRGTFKKHGKWALPVFPTNISIQGSVPTPYIFDDRCSAEDAAEQIYNLYKMSSKERKEIGLEGHKWATSDEAGFTSEKMGENIIEGMEELFSTWQPREKFEFLSDDDFQPRKLEHSLKY
jgi:glycosyltransferase involved in cell wall biosynthesis